MREEKKNTLLAKLLCVRDHMPKSSYMMHVVVGVFMFYIVYQLATSGDDSVPLIVMILAYVFFSLTGLFLIAGALYAFAYGIYRENRDEAETETEAETEEVVDVVDEEGNPTGEVVERTKAHALGIRHRTSHVWLLRKKDGKVQVLLQKRSEEKDSFPGCFDTSSAGHIPAGCDYVASALRELKEELGVTVEESALHFLGTKFFEFEGSFHEGEYHDKQISNIYAVWLDKEEEEFTLQREELSEVKWFDLEDCIAKIQKKEIPNCINTDEILLVKDYVDKQADADH